MGFFFSKVQVTFDFLEDPGEVYSTTRCVCGRYVVFFCLLFGFWFVYFILGCYLYVGQNIPRTIKRKEENIQIYEIKICIVFRYLVGLSNINNILY